MLPAPREPPSRDPGSNDLLDELRNNQHDLVYDALIRAGNREPREKLIRGIIDGLFLDEEEVQA